MTASVSSKRVRNYAHLSHPERLSIIEDAKAGIGLVELKTRYKRDYHLIVALLTDTIDGFTPRTHALYIKDLRRRILETRKVKVCCICKVAKSLDEYSLDSSSPDDRAYACKMCALAATKEYHFKNHTKSKRATRAGYIYRTFGLSIEEYESKLKNQKYKCSICQKQLKIGKQNLDHCHATGKIREFLCNNCNRGLGHFQENSVFLIRAAEYLERHDE